MHTLNPKGLIVYADCNTAQAGHQEPGRAARGVLQAVQRQASVRFPGGKLGRACSQDQQRLLALPGFQLFGDRDSTEA